MLLLSGLPNAVIIITILFFLLGYLIGSTPFGLLFAKMAGHGDIRDIGSGNIGATNVLRTGNKKLAALTLLADILKGALPMLFIAWLAPAFSFAPLIVGFGAFLGHLYPFWLKFRGGKGVATFLGVLIGYNWQLALVFAFCWVAVAYLSRISSFSALSASVLTLLASFVMGFSSPLLTIMTALIFWKHRDNIKRLADGTESRIGKGK